MNAKIKTTDLANVKHMGREFVLYQIQDSELDQLTTGYNSIHLGLSGMAFGALVTVVTTWITRVSPSLKETVIYFSSTIILGLTTLYLGLMAIKDYSNARKVVQGIRTNSKLID
jgi:hypothetical protein